MEGYEALRSGIRSGLFLLPKNNQIEIATKPRCFISYKHQYTFASRNSSPSTDEYWATPRASILNKDWTLILNDTIKNELHVFFIPEGTLNPSQFRKKGILRNQLRIDIDCVNNPNFTNKGPVPVDFKQWYVESILYTL